MTSSVRLSRAILDLLAREFGTSVIYTALVRVCAELHTTHPEQGEDIIRNIWRMMVGDVSKLIEKAPPGQAVAITVLDAYFARRGDWKRIVREAEEALVETGISGEEAKSFEEGVQANVRALLEVYRGKPPA